MSTGRELGGEHTRVQAPVVPGPTPDRAADTSRARLLTSLQRAAGNRAVRHLVQRQHHDIGDRGLSEAQLAAARTAYERDPARYPPGLVRRIQRRLRVSPTGRVDDATIGAVAAWQAAHRPHPVTGIASGPVLAQLFPEGLATRASQRSFLRGADGLGTEWAQLAPGARGARALELGNARLAAIGVPPCHPRPGVGGGRAGGFQPRTWSIELHPGYLTAPALSEELLASVYHEARHAEQHFLVIRYLAGSAGESSGEAIIRGVPPEVAAAAARRPVRPGSAEAVVAQDLLASVGDESIGRVVGRRNAADAALNRALDEQERHPSPETDRAVARAERAADAADRAYRMQNHEFDAYAVERGLRSLHGDRGS